MFTFNGKKVIAVEETDNETIIYTKHNGHYQTTVIKNEVTKKD